MVRPIKNRSTLDQIREVSTSPFFMPIIIFAMVVISAPVIYLTTQSQIDIRQRAATIARGGLVVDTNDSSYKSATESVMPEKTIDASMLLVGSVVIVISLIAIIAYRKKIASF